MGSYNVSCSVSGLSLNPGDPTVFFLLGKSKWQNKLNDGNVYGMKTTDYYTPVYFPIIGSYGDYGYIENVVNDLNWEQILNSTFYKECAERKDHFDPLSFINNDYKKYNDVVTGMYVHGDVYKDMVQNAYDEWGKKLKNYGFFDKIDIKEQINRLLLTMKKSAKEFGALIQALEKDQGEQLKWTLKSEQMLKIEQMIVGRKLPLINVMSERHPDLLDRILHWFVEGKAGLDYLEKSIGDLLIFDHSLFSVGRMYFPTITGYQFGNSYAVRRLSSVTNNIARNTIKRMNS